MFLYLIDYLGSISSSFYVFEYITLRAILSIITALVISLLIGPILIKKFSTNLCLLFILKNLVVEKL